MELEYGNRKVVESYRHVHLCYELHVNGEVQLDLGYTRDVIRPSMVIVDPYRFSHDFGK